VKSAEQLRDERLALPPVLPELQAKLAEIRGVLGVGVGLRIPARASSPDVYRVYLCPALNPAEPSARRRG
jgi:hypothetical protein